MDSQHSPRPHPWWIWLLVGVALAAGLWGLCACWPPRPDDPLPLRWARICALHPLRTALGLGCLTLGLLGARSLGRIGPRG